MKITDEMVMRGQLATNGLKYGLTDAEMRSALEAAVADVPVPKAVKVDAERATEKLKLWFFRDLLDEHRTMLFGLFGMPVSEIRNQGDQVHAFRHVVAALAAPAPEVVKDDRPEKTQVDAAKAAVLWALKRFKNTQTPEELLLTIFECPSLVSALNAEGK